MFFTACRRSGLTSGFFRSLDRVSMGFEICPSSHETSAWLDFVSTSILPFPYYIFLSSCIQRGELRILSIRRSSSIFCSEFRSKTRCAKMCIQYVARYFCLRKCPWNLKSLKGIIVLEIKRVFVRENMYWLYKIERESCRKMSICRKKVLFRKFKKKGRLKAYIRSKSCKDENKTSTRKVDYSKDEAESDSDGIPRPQKSFEFYNLSGRPHA